MRFGTKALLALALLLSAGCQSSPFDSRDIPDVVAVADGSAQRAALNARVYDAAVQTVTRRFYDRDFNGVDFRAEAAARRADALSRPDEDGFYEALNGVLELLGDDHTAATPPTIWRNRQVRRVSGAADWGIRAVKATAQETGESFYFVTRIRPDGPGALAGVQPGWRIESVNGAAWTGAQSLGPDAPDVIRFIDRDGQMQVRSLRTLQMPTEIGTAVRRPDGVLVLKLFRFNDETADWLEARLTEARADPPRAVVVDLQTNEGGTIVSSRRIIGAFFRAGVPFARTRYGPLQGTTERTRPFEHAWTGPLAVVVSDDSESAAEVFAAAMQERRRAVVVGEKTAGAVVRAVTTPLPDGGLLTVGISEFLTASGATLEKVGVTPDVPVTTTYDDLVSGRDAFVEAAVRTLLATPA